MQFAFLSNDSKFWLQAIKSSPKIDLDECQLVVSYILLSSYPGRRQVVWQFNLSF